MKNILTSQGRFAIVDDEDFDFLSKYKWQSFAAKKTFYATAHINGKTVYMHRMIMGVLNTKKIIDHIDHDGLNNCRYNLRAATYSQNNMNTLHRRRKNPTSKYKGVHWDSITKKWRAGIMHRKIGRFVNEVDAAIAYNERAFELFGEFACLNEVA